jgi:hypothetical protein
VTHKLGCEICTLVVGGAVGALAHAKQGTMVGWKRMPTTDKTQMNVSGVDVYGFY